MSSSRTVGAKPRQLPCLQFKIFQQWKKPTWALDVSDDGTCSIVHEFDADLSDTTSRACRFPVLLDLCALHFYSFLRKGVGVPVRPRTRVTLTSLTGTLLYLCQSQDSHSEMSGEHELGGIHVCDVKDGNVCRWMCRWAVVGVECNFFEVREMPRTGAKTEVLV